MVVVVAIVVFVVVAALDDIVLLTVAGYQLLWQCWGILKNVKMFLASIFPTPLSKAVASSVYPSNKCCPTLSAVKALYSSKQLQLMLIPDTVSQTYTTSMSSVDKSSD